MTTWTVEKVKEELPNIPCLINGIPLSGRVRGRLNAFASMYVVLEGQEIMSEDYAWETLVRVLNRGTPLIWESGP